MYCEICNFCFKLLHVNIILECWILVRLLRGVNGKSKASEVEANVVVHKSIET